MNEELAKAIVTALSSGGVEAAGLAKWYILLNSPFAYALAWLLPLTVLFLFVRALLIRMNKAELEEIEAKKG